MLRITVQERGSEVVVLLEGRLERPWVSELELAVAQQRLDSATPRPVVVDLNGLTGIDEAGESSLQNLYKNGATLRCADVMNDHLVERITHGWVKPLQAPCRPSQAEPRKLHPRGGRK